MKVSRITKKHLADYLRLEYEDLSTAEKEEIKTFFDAARSFIRSYTGLTDKQINTHDDMVIVVYILVQDMYDNRTLYVDKNNLNKTVETILGMHSVNLL